MYIYIYIIGGKMNNEVRENPRSNDDDSFEYKYGMEPTLACHLPYPFHPLARKGKERKERGVGSGE